MANNKNSPLPPGEGPGVRAASVRRNWDPYVQVALTYVRRPFSSWFGGVATVGYAVGMSMFCVADRARLPRDSAFHLMYLMYAFFYFFAFLALHMRRQFADSRAHLIPRFRRVNIAVAAVAAIVFTGLLPAAVSWSRGWHSIGFPAVMVLLFGTALWASGWNWTQGG